MPDIPTVFDEIATFLQAEITSQGGLLNALIRDSEGNIYYPGLYLIVMLPIALTIIFFKLIHSTYKQLNGRPDDNNVP